MAAGAGASIAFGALGRVLHRHFFRVNTCLIGSSLCARSNTYAHNETRPVEKLAKHAT